MAQDSNETTKTCDDEKKAGEDVCWLCFQTAQAGTLASLSALQEGRRVLSPSGNPGQQLHPQSGAWLRASLGCAQRTSTLALAWQAPPAREPATQAREAKASRRDRHSLLAQDAANSSRGAGSHSSVLGEGAEDGSRQGDHHGRGLDHHPGVLALAHTGLIAAVGQRGRATGTAQIKAGHGGGMEVDLEREQQNTASVGSGLAACLSGEEAEAGEQGQVVYAHREAWQPRSPVAPAESAKDLLPSPPILASRTELVGAPSRSKAHTKACTEAKTQWGPEEQEEKQSKSEEKATAAHLVHQGGEGKRSG